jgi:hypothetical protein
MMLKLILLSADLYLQPTYLYQPEKVEIVAYCGEKNQLFCYLTSPFTFGANRPQNLQLKEHFAAGSD